MPTVTDNIGRTGLPVFNGQVMADFLTEFRGREAYKRINEMRLNSPEIGALLAAIDFGIRGTVEWQWESDEGEDDPRIEFLDRALANLRHSWVDHVSEALTMPVFGFAPFALWYERVGGEILWRKYVLLGQDTVQSWDIDDEGTIHGMWQSAPPRYTPEYVPIERMVLYRTRVERNNPEGRSLLRNAWIPYYYSKNLKHIEAIGVERDMAGLPKVKLPATASATDEAKAEKIVRNIRNDEQAGIVEPHNFEVSLLTSGGSRMFDTDKIIGRYDQRMLMSVLSQFLLLGSDGVGSLALSRDQTDFFGMLLNGLADIIAETFSAFAVPRILKLNGYPTEGIRRTHTPAGDIDLAGLTAALQSAGDKITWRPQDESWLRQTLQLPEATPEELAAEKQERQAKALEIARQRGPAVAADDEAGAERTFPPDKEQDEMRAEFYAATRQFREAMNA